MPLVVPGVMTSNGGSQQDNWMSKLAGKKITDSTTNETVRLLILISFRAQRPVPDISGYVEFFKAGSSKRSSNR